MRGDEAREERESIEKSIFEFARGEKFSTIKDGILLSMEVSLAELRGSVL